MKDWLKKKTPLSFYIVKNSVLHGNQARHAKHKFDGELKIPEKTLLLLESGSNFQFRNIFWC